MLDKHDIWYSYTLEPYPKKDPAFYDTSNFNWVSILEDNFELIKKEILQFVESESLKPYFNKNLVNKKNSWKTEDLLFWGFFSKKYYSQLKNSWSIIKQIPGISSFSISLLDSESRIKPHHGDTNAIIRVHFPILVPASLPQCGFTVNNESRSWEEGKALLFNDAHFHEAFNLSAQKRVILLIDVIRPEFLNYKYEIYGKVLNGLAWQWWTQAYPNIRNSPLRFRKFLWSSTRFLVEISLRFNTLFWK